MARRRSGGNKTVSVDLSGTTTGGGFKPLDPGVYPVMIKSAEIKEGPKANYIAFEFEVTEGGSKGSKLKDNCSLSPAALFSLRGLLEALGFDIPEKKFDVDLDELIGLELDVEVTIGSYKKDGKDKPNNVIVAYLSIDGDEEEEEEDGDIEELLDELDLKDAKELAKELGIKAIKLKKLKKLSGVIDLIMEEDEEDIQDAYDELFGDEEDEDEDEDEEDGDYEDMSLSELRAEAKDRGLRTKGKSKDDLIEMLEEDDE